jgi:hypothetical protein
MVAGGANGEPGWAVSACRVMRFCLRRKGTSMDGQRFDALLRQVAGRSRRAVLIALASGFVSALSDHRDTVAGSVTPASTTARAASAGSAAGTGIVQRARPAPAGPAPEAVAAPARGRGCHASLAPTVVPRLPAVSAAPLAPAATYAARSVKSARLAALGVTRFARMEVGPVPATATAAVPIPAASAVPSRAAARSAAPPVRSAPWVGLGATLLDSSDASFGPVVNPTYQRALCPFIAGT